MTVLDIITIENDKDGILRRPAEVVPLEEVPNLQELIADMIETTVATRALGLAAPQVGVPMQLFVLNDGTVYINPVITMTSGRVTSYGEGCLSVGEFYNIKRFRYVTIKYVDEKGNFKTIKPHRKRHSIVCQHEIDHLKGVLICDKRRR